MASEDLPPRRSLSLGSGKRVQVEIMAGWLCKRGGRVPSWKRRYFILSGSCLYYFTSPKDAAPLGTVAEELELVILAGGASRLGLGKAAGRAAGGAAGGNAVAQLQN